MKTDILHTLQAVLLENTTSYQSDFEFDVTTLLEAVNKPRKRIVPTTGSLAHAVHGASRKRRSF